MLFSCITAELPLSAESRESYVGRAYSVDDGASRPAASRQRSSLRAACVTRQQQPLGRPRHPTKFTRQWTDGRRCFTAWQEPTLDCSASPELHFTQSNVLLILMCFLLWLYMYRQNVSVQQNVGFCTKICNSRFSTGVSLLAILSKLQVHRAVL